MNLSRQIAILENIFFIFICFIMPMNVISASSVKNQTHYLKDYSPPLFFIDKVNLEIDLYDDKAIVTNTMAIIPVGKTSKSLVLNGIDQELLEVRVNNKILSCNEYHLTDKELIVPNVEKPTEVTVVSKVLPQKNTSLQGLFKVNDAYYITHCEPHGFRKITYYPDRPDVMSRFTTKIIADKKYPVLLSNGNKIKEGDLKRNRHYVVYDDPIKKPSYLFASVIGDLKCNKDVFVTKSGKKVDLELYVLDKNDVPKTNYAMESLKASMRWDEEKFGREYDLSRYIIVNTPEFNAGAMENKGLNIFNSSYVLADKDTATDMNYQNVRGTIGHEYFHNWTGNRITLRDWFQLSLKEGLTVFRDQEFSADEFSRTLRRIMDASFIKTSQFKEDSGPLAHSVRPDSYISMDNFYTVTVYYKGAEVIRMLQTLLGKEGFAKGMSLYFDRYDGQAITCDDFVKAMEDANDVDLKQFRLWYSQAGTPILNVKSKYDSKNKTYTLFVKQTCPNTPGQSKKKPFNIPIKVGLISAKTGKGLEFTYNNKTGYEHILDLKTSGEQFVLHNVEEAPLPSLLRDFSAPVTLNYPYTDTQLLFLLHNDDNEFNKRDAGQRYVKDLLIKLYKTKDRRAYEKQIKEYIDSIKSVLFDQKMDKQFIASLIILPSKETIYQNIKNVDPDGVYEARRYLLTRIGKTLKKELQDSYEALSKKLGTHPYSLEQQDIGSRALKNVCLSYLYYADEKLAIKLAKEQLAKSDNLTDRLSALSILFDATDDVVYTEAADKFYKKWKDNDLVVDKWLALQAMSQRADVYKKVVQLKRHKVFNIKNPNKVYALVATFVHNHMFHDSNGQGYKFLADIILELDKINPETAGRIASLFSDWRRFEPKRRDKMHKCLKGIQASSNLSDNVREIINKSLEEA